MTSPIAPQSRREATRVRETADGGLITSAPRPWVRHVTPTSEPLHESSTSRPSHPPITAPDFYRPPLNNVSGASRALEISGGVLPELEDAPVTRRPLWRHPASIISAITTLLALIAAGVLFFMGFFTSDARVTEMELTASENVVHVSWVGPDVPYQVIVLDGPAGEELDVSQNVTGTDVWLPTAAALIDTGSCVVVRPALGNEKAPIALDRATLDTQGGQAKCVADAAAQ